MTAAVLVTLLAALITQAPVKPGDFSGLWVQDNAKSLLMDISPRDVKLSVVDSGQNVKVVRSVKTSNPKIPGGWFEAETYSGSTDGKSSDQRIPDMHYARLLAREGRDLVWRITLTRASDGGATTFSERWSLSADQNSLTILRTYRDGREVTQVFARQRRDL